MTEAEKKDLERRKSELFEAAIEECIEESSVAEILSIPGVAEILREHFNNDAIYKMSDEAQELDQIFAMTRDEMIERLEEVCIHCEEGEARTVLREALITNVQDGTISL